MNDFTRREVIKLDELVLKTNDQEYERPIGIAHSAALKWNSWLKLSRRRASPAYARSGVHGARVETAN